MQLSEFDFPFDPQLVASQPVMPRDQARLLVLHRGTDHLMHHQVSDLPLLLEPGDLVIVNDTKVLAARMRGLKQPGGTPAEVLFVKDLGDHVWEIMVKGRYRVGQVIQFSADAHATIVKRDAGGTQVKVYSAVPVADLLRAQGEMPLPPYIKRASTEEDRRWYQTLFATHEGAIAAPTAGLHFTPSLVAHLKSRGIRLATITLHVGPGTFTPVSADRVEDHHMAEEAFALNEDVVKAIIDTKLAGRRVVAVGTTVVRALETAAQETGMVTSMSGQSRLLITPGFRFKVVDALMTNFHLPRTTLLMLVAAFAGIESVRKAYESAVSTRYRFYSYGDAMLIL